MCADSDGFGANEQLLLGESKTHKLIVLNNNNDNLWHQELFQDNLQYEHRYTNGGAAAEIVAILEEAREGREERRRYIGTIFCSFQVL